MWFFNNEIVLRTWEKDRDKIIDNRIKYINVKPRSLRRYFKIQYMTPSLFQDSLAKWMASQINGDMIYDPFAGFGGRMLGVVSINKFYLGVDINKLTVNGNLSIMKELGLEKKANIINADSSQMNGMKCDGIITSVPFMNLDNYDQEKFKSTEEFQTFINNTFKHVEIRDLAIIDFKAVKGCSLDEFEKALPFKFIKRREISFGGMSRVNKSNKSIHTFFYCRNI